MKINETHKGKVPLDQFPLGTYILGRDFDGEDNYFYVYMIIEIEGIRQLRSQEFWYISQDAAYFDEWAVLEVEDEICI